MKKILIVGSRGMLGKELAKIFSDDESYNVLGIDLEHINIADKNEVESLVLKEMPEVIINAAAYNAVDKAEESEEEFVRAMQTNGKAPGYLAKAAKERGAIFVHFSSDYVFDGEVGEYLETDQTNPISNYGKSKETGEKNALGKCEQIYLIRTSKLFGSPGLRENSKKSFFQIMLELSRKKNLIRVVDSEKSCFTYVPDLAAATKDLLEKSLPFGIYHLVNEGAATWYQATKKLFELAKIKNTKVIPVGPEEFNRKAKRPISSVLKNSKLPKMRPYHIALEEWLKEATEWGKS